MLEIVAKAHAHRFDAIQACGRLRRKATNAHKAISLGCLSCGPSLAFRATMRNDVAQHAAAPFGPVDQLTQPLFCLQKADFAFSFFAIFLLLSQEPFFPAVQMLGCCSPSTLQSEHTAASKLAVSAAAIVGQLQPGSVWWRPPRPQLDHSAAPCPEL